MSSSFTVLPIILPVMEEGVIVLDKAGRIRLCNDAAARVFCLDETARGSRLEGKDMADVCRLQELASLASEVLEDGEEFHGEINNQQGAVRRVDVSLVPKQKKGAVIGAAILLRDRTEVWHLERVRQDFVANVSHELRTPIAAIRGWSETLASDAFELPEFVREQLITIQRHSDRLTALVNDLLALAKAEAIGIRDRFDRTSLEDILSEIIATQHDVLNSKQLTVTVAIAPELAVIQTDARALEYILRNLVENAIKYSDPGGEVVIKAQRRKKGRLVVSVADDGMGIDKQHLPRLFERFYRVDKGRSRSEGGTGLGLAIVKHFASALGGDVKVTSQVGKGSEFVVRLPREAWELPDSAG